MAAEYTELISELVGLELMNKHKDDKPYCSIYSSVELKKNGIGQALSLKNKHKWQNIDRLPDFP